MLRTTKKQLYQGRYSSGNETVSTLINILSRFYSRACLSLCNQQPFCHLKTLVLNPANSMLTRATLLSLLGAVSALPEGAPPAYEGSSSQAPPAYTTPASSSVSYACNPAHDYGNGVSCISTAGSLTLVTPAPSSSASYACQWSCKILRRASLLIRATGNPAHQYPEGQTCTEVSGSLTLVTATPSASASYACR